MRATRTLTDRATPGGIEKRRLPSRAEFRLRDDTVESTTAPRQRAGPWQRMRSATIPRRDSVASRVAMATRLRGADGRTAAGGVGGALTGGRGRVDSTAEARNP